MRKKEETVTFYQPTAGRINPTPVGRIPTPVGINPTAGRINPTPVGANPTPVGINPTAGRINPTPVGNNPTGVEKNSENFLKIEIVGFPKKRENQGIHIQGLYNKL